MVVTPQSLDVLMYHSISDGSGPTCIDPATFEMQLEVLAELGYRSVSLEDVVAWREGRGGLPPRPVLITFDDGFRDFSLAAWPRLRQFGFRAVVFVPTGHVGGSDVWECPRIQPSSADGSVAPPADAAKLPSRPLMSWEEILQLGGEGVEFAGHSVHHWDLTQLATQHVDREINGCKEELESRLGGPVLAFAPPYGRSNESVRKAIARTYSLSFGTVLGRVVESSDRWDLPRIEMHYFRRADRWRTHLSGGGRWWLAARRSLRAVRQAARGHLRTQQRNSPIELTSTE